MCKAVPLHKNPFSILKIPNLPSTVQKTIVTNTQTPIKHRTIDLKKSEKKSMLSDCHPLRSTGNN